MFNFAHIKMMKIPFEIIRQHYLVLVTKRNLGFCVCFYVNIHVNKNRNSVHQNLKIVFEIKIYQVIGKNIYNQIAAKAKKVELREVFIKILVAFLETSETSKMQLFVKLVNRIKPLTIFTKGFILDV